MALTPAKMNQSAVVQITLLVLCACFGHLVALPLDAVSEAPPNAAVEQAAATPESPLTATPTISTPVPEAAGNNEAPAAPSASAENANKNGNAPENGKITANTAPTAEGAATDTDYDPSAAAASSLYASLLTPDALQQYINQFGAAYPGYAAYPAPIGYAPPLPPPPGPVYPGPYVQTGYEGYLVPANVAAQQNTNSAAGTSTAVATSNNNGTSSTFLQNPMTYLSNLLPALMMSTIFRVLASVFAAIAMVMFGGTLARAICDLTPICDVSMRAMTYLRSDKNAARVGRMLVEGITPERVRRTTEFVRDAIRKYRRLQHEWDDEE